MTSPSPNPSSPERKFRGGRGMLAGKMARKLKGKPFPHIVLAARSLRKNETEAEKKLWQEIRNGNLENLKFRRQHPIGNFVLDFYCVEYQLAVEVDDDIHTNVDQQILDRSREDELTQKGITVLRISNTDVMNDITRVKETIMKSVNDISRRNTTTILLRVRS
jgi:very-short-patch-repair endonuclease